MMWIDYDGVCVDFKRGVYERTGLDITSKGFNDLGQAKRNKIYAEACDTLDFWISLAPMPDFDKLWSYVKYWNPHILTAYPMWSKAGVDVAIKGKAIWNKAHTKVPGNRFHCVSRVEKQLFALNSDDVLIDDKDKNIDEWVAAGGKGILHTSAADTIKQLKALGFTK